MQVWIAKVPKPAVCLDIFSGTLRRQQVLIKLGALLCRAQDIFPFDSVTPLSGRTPLSKPHCRQCPLHSLPSLWKCPWCRRLPGAHKTLHIQALHRQCEQGRTALIAIELKANPLGQLVCSHSTDQNKSLNHNTTSVPLPCHAVLSRWGEKGKLSFHSLQIN